MTTCFQPEVPTGVSAQTVDKAQYLQTIGKFDGKFDGLDGVSRKMAIKFLKCETHPQFESPG